jgi:hypothetical protein
MPLNPVDAVSVAALRAEYDNVTAMVARIEKRLAENEMEPDWDKRKVKRPEGSLSWDGDRDAEREFLKGLLSSLNKLLSADPRGIRGWIKSWENIERTDYGRSPPVPAWKVKAKAEVKASVNYVAPAIVAFDPDCD